MTSASYNLGHFSIQMDLPFESLILILMIVALIYFLIVVRLILIKHPICINLEFPLEVCFIIPIVQKRKQA